MQMRAATGESLSLTSTCSSRIINSNLQIRKLHRPIESGDKKAFLPLLLLAFNISLLRVAAELCFVLGTLIQSPPFGGTFILATIHALEPSADTYVALHR
jgi:hypothetical protein